jgi:hypothetical protein
MPPIDTESPAGSWHRELAARGMLKPGRPQYKCTACGWTGTEPSITDASSAVERDGKLEVDRTHLSVCPKCFEVISCVQLSNFK